MTDEEAAAVGPALKRCQAVLENVTGCDRVYMAALGSEKSGSHFHAHMVPLYKDTGTGKPPIHVTGTPFDAFLQEKLAGDGVEGAAADEAACASVAAAFAQAMADEERRSQRRSKELVDEEREDR